MTPEQLAEQMKAAHDRQWLALDGCHEWADKRKSLPRLRAMQTAPIDAARLARAMEAVPVWPIREGWKLGSLAQEIAAAYERAQ